MPGASAGDGVNEMTFPFTAIVPVAGVPFACVTVKVVFITDAGATGSEKVTVIAAVREEPVAAAAGTFAVTVGGAFGPVVNDQVWPEFSRLPSRSSTPGATVPVYWVLYARGAVG